MILTSVALLLAAGEPPAAELPKDKLICRRETPTGSLIASRKMCLTSAEWDKRSRDGNEEARKMAYENMGRCFDPGLCPR